MSDSHWPAWRRWWHSVVDAPITSGARRAFITLFLVTLMLFGVNLLFTAHEVNAARQASASAVQLCRLGNEARSQQISLWTYVATISQPPPGETARQKRHQDAVIKAFLAHVRKVFAPRDCAGSILHQGGQ